MRSGEFDVDAMAARAGRDFPALYQLFGGYFHMDWKDEYDTWEAAVRAFAAEAPPHLREDAIAEIGRILAHNLEEDQLARVLYPGLQCHLLPPAIGITNGDWMRSVAALIAGG